jgi:hypothetical protein
MTPETMPTDEKENLIEPTESNVRYWTQRIEDELVPGSSTDDIAKVIRELLEKDTHYAALTSRESVAAEVPTAKELLQLYWDNGGAMVGISAVREACLKAMAVRCDEGWWDKQYRHLQDRAEKAEAERDEAQRKLQARYDLQRAPYSRKCQQAIEDVERRFESEHVELVSMEHHTKRIDKLEAEAASLRAENDTLKRENVNTWRAHGDMFNECAGRIGDIKRSLRELLNNCPDCDGKGGHTYTSDPQGGQHPCQRCSPIRDVLKQIAAPPTQEPATVEKCPTCGANREQEPLANPSRRCFARFHDTAPTPAPAWTPKFAVGDWVTTKDQPDAEWKRRVKHVDPLTKLYRLESKDGITLFGAWIESDLSPLPPTQDKPKLVPLESDGVGELISYLHAMGWMVAVHNDYRLNGKLHCFWLFTKGEQCVKGEGEDNYSALMWCIGRAQSLAEPASLHQQEGGEA